MSGTESNIFASALRNHLHRQVVDYEGGCPDYLLAIDDDQTHPDYLLLQACQVVADTIEKANQIARANAPWEEIENAVYIAERKAASIPPKTLAGQLAIVELRARSILDMEEIDRMCADPDKPFIRNANTENGLYACAIAAEALRHAARGEFWDMAGVI